MTRELTGSKVFAIAATFFGVIIAVNTLLAYKAVETFPGLEVANSYVASQSFDKERAAQVALGWTLDYGFADGKLTLSFQDKTKAPVEVQALAALVGRPTETAQDQVPEFSFSDGKYVAPMTLDKGRWLIMVEAKAADGTRFHQRLSLDVKG